MKKQLFVALAILAFAINAHAITGAFSYSGGFIALNAANAPVTDLTLATQVQFNTGGATPDPSVTNGVGTGSFAAIPDNTPVTYAGTGTLRFLPTPNTPLTPFFTLPGITFGLNTINRDYVSPFSLILTGAGTFNNTGGTDPSPGIYTASFNTITGSFSYSASAGVPVPDGGSALALLGMSLVGVEALRRKFAV